MLVIIILIVFSENAFGIDWVNFTVTRHVNTTFTAATFDNAMNVVNMRMQLNNHHCTDDVPCTARFRRSGALGIFGITGDGLDIITNQNELSQVFGVATHRIKVVTSIDYCAGSYNPSIIGCGRCNDFGFILENWVQDTYVHEYGHNVMGCGHRNDCEWNIMNALSNGQNDSVNSSECSGFGGKAYPKLCGNIYDGNGGPLTSNDGPYWVTCTVTVPAGQNLTIQAGVEIQFNFDNKITSNGFMNADGSTNRILLYSNRMGFPSLKIDKKLQLKNGGQLLMH